MYDHKKLERGVLKYWAKNKIPDRVRKRNRGKKPFYFADGPPYATGSIHMGTAWNKILKDVFIRFWRMKGFDSWDQPGYDTHGTPIEVRVEKELGFSSKKDIESFGVDRFVKKCREFATKYIGIMSRQFEDLGVWMNWENPYLTLKNEYIEGAWFTFKKAFEKGFLYRGLYPVHVCTRCETVVAYNEIEHKKLSDPSIFVKFPLRGKKEFLVIWTTTPWTIIANTGIMVHPRFDYSFVEIPTGEVLVIAKELVKDKMTEVVETGNYKIVKTVKGKDLEGLKYEHPLKDMVPGLQGLKNAHRVVTSSRYVTLEEGTGLVHTAPGHGMEDFLVGKERGLPQISPVNIDGTFTKEAGKWLEGKYTKEMDSEIIRKLSEKGRLMWRGEITHDYPTCWRCSTPLLQISVPQWFFKITSVRNRLLSENKKVNWIPEWAGSRFNNWLENLGDWPVSRQRYWGIPLPIWLCKGKGCEEVEVFGSFSELKKRSGLKKEIDLHKPGIDNVSFPCKKCGSEMGRTPDVLDVWFDAGVSTWASLGYPRNKKFFERMWPSDFQLEGPDQFRGWWNSQMITSVLTFGKAPFKNVLLHGFVQDVKGSKMSKSKGGFVSPEEVVDKYGRDVFRFYLMSSPAWNNFYFNWEDLKETARMFTVFWNVYNFIFIYVKNRKAKKVGLRPEDRWIISKVNSVLEDGKFLEAYQAHKLVQSLGEFILNDLSRWYIKIIRDRVSPMYTGKDRESAEYTLMYVMDRILRALAPISPFVTETMYRELFGKDSVHLSEWPGVEKALVNKKLERHMEILKDMVESVNALRQEQGIKIKWPVSELFVYTTKKELRETVKTLEGVIRFMCNCGDIRVLSKGSGKKEFEGGTLALGEILKDQALVRELIRSVQILRKKEGLDVREGIMLSLKSDDKTEGVLKDNEKDILEGTGSKELVLGKVKSPKGKMEFEGRKIDIGFVGVK